MWGRESAFLSKERGEIGTKNLLHFGRSLAVPPLDL